MSELCLSSTTKKTTQFSTTLLSDFFLFCSFILSHPLYFSYFIFFSPYLLKLLSFLSPLFITTALLLLLSLLTVSPGLIHHNSAPELSESKVGIILSTYQAFLERLRSKTDDVQDKEFHDHFEELEAYRIVFDTSIFDARESPVEVLESIKSDENQPFMEGKTLESFLKELDEFENMACNVEEKKIETFGSNSDKVEENREDSLVRSGSEATVVVKVNTDKGREYTLKVAADSKGVGANVNGSDDEGEYTSGSRRMGSNLGNYGSMRKEKEWKRTLACKLFEERHNMDGGEGMDLLWETYEMDSSKAKTKGNTKKNKKKGESEYYEDGYDEEEEEMDGQLCCLQALKFSAGKMNLGMGRPNLVKISKAIKGIGWLHHLGRHGKKGYN